MPSVLSPFILGSVSTVSFSGSPLLRWLAEILQQRFQIIRWQGLHSGRHDRELRAFHRSNVFALNSVFLSGRVEDFHRGLRLGLQSAGVRFTAFGGEVPEAVICFNRTGGGEEVDEDFSAGARGEAAQSRTDLFP